VDDAIVTQKEIGRTKAGSAQRALLQYWRDMQYKAWTTAAERYDPGLRRYLGGSRILNGLSTQAAEFRASRPFITGVAKRGGETVTYFVVRDTKHTETPTSIAWKRVGGSWQIAYDPSLDDALAVASQQAAQLRIDPAAQKPSTAALRAGSAARKLQQAYLGRRLAP
jgi:hypothetical protein